MDHTGFLHKLTTSLSRSWKLYQQKETTPEANAYHESLKETQQLFKTVTTEKDPVMLTLLTEKVCLQQELETYSNSREMAGSIKTALAQLGDAMASYLVVRQPDAYKTSASTFSAK